MFLLLLILAFLTFIAFRINRVRNYWNSHGIPNIPSIPFVGNFWETFAFRKSGAEQFEDLYYDEKTKNEPVVGIHCFHKPSLMVKDPELIKRVLIKDFSNFSDRYTLYLHKIPNL